MHSDIVTKNVSLKLAEILEENRAFCTKFKLTKGQTLLVYTYETYSKVYLQKRTQSMFKIAKNQRNLDCRSRIPKRKHIAAVKTRMSSRVDIVTL